MTMKFNEELIAKILHDAPISIMVIDKNGLITFVNKYFKNFSNSKLPLNRSIFDIPFFVRENLAPAYKKLLATGTQVKKENCHTTNALGEEKHINITAVPLRNNDGKIEGALSMAIDVTDIVSTHIKLEELNAKLEDKVVKRTEQLYKINKRLRKSLELKSQFICDASHELRTPLSIIKLTLELADRNCRETCTKTPNILKTINKEINKITDIIADLSLSTNININDEKVRMQKVDINKLLKDTVERLKVFSNDKNITVGLEGYEKQLAIKGDKEKLEKLFLNIIRNAIKYNNRDGWVKIWVNNNNNFIEINVKDNGIGIPKDELPYIFDRFYRSSLSQNQGEGGFGLGLSICKWIAKQHKGSINVKSSVGKGSLFTVNLPIETI